MSEFRTNVCWRPEGADVNVSHDKSSRGNKAAAVAEAVAHIERNHMKLITLKLTDRV